MPTISMIGRTMMAIAIAFTTLGSPSVARAQTSIDRWLVLGPATAPIPFGAPASDSARLEAFRLPTDKGWPSEGATVTMPGSAPLRWQPGNGATTNGSVVFAAAYLTADRWTRATVQVTGGDAASRRVWLDGARVGSAPVDLSQGKHFLLVARAGGGSDAGTPLVATLTPTRGDGVLATSLDPTHAASFRTLRDMVAFTDVALNPAGTRAAYTTRHQDAVLDRNVQALEVREVATGRLLAQLPGDLSSPLWSRDGERLAYLAPAERRDPPGGRDLMMWEAKTGAVTRVIAYEPAARLIGCAL